MAKKKKTASAAVMRPQKKLSARKKSTTISAEERVQMIAEAAYFNSINRETKSGNPESDWLLAEKQIEQQLITEGVQNE